MTEQHPITPPPELLEKWHNEWRDGTFIGLENYIAMQAARWGADQELEACCEWLRSKDILEPAIEALRTARRPKPLSLKEQALEELEKWREVIGVPQLDTIRRALEQLDD